MKKRICRSFDRPRLRDKAKIMDWFNQTLEILGAELRLISYSRSETLLSNGLILSATEMVRLKLTFTSPDGKHCIDDLFSIDPNLVYETKRKIKAAASLRGAISNLAQNYETLAETGRSSLKKMREDGKARPYKPGSVPWNKGRTKDTCPIVASVAAQKIGALNTSYGKSPSAATRRKQSDTMKNRIADGTFTPNIMNSLTSKSIEWNGKVYRSSWEAVFGCLHPNLQYETIRIPFQHNGGLHTYIVDFIDTVNKIIYEVKPRRFINRPINTAKMRALQRWCIENGYTAQVIEDDMIGMFVSKLPSDHPIFANFTVHMIRGLHKLHETYFKN